MVREEDGVWEEWVGEFTFWLSPPWKSNPMHDVLSPPERSMQFPAWALMNL